MKEKSHKIKAHLGFSEAADSENATERAGLPLASHRVLRT